MITVQMFYRWRKEYGGLKMDQAKRLKELMSAISVTSCIQINLSRSDQNRTAWTGIACDTLAMTTKTIPEYLEDERQKDRDAQLRMDEETARIQPLNHGHHRTAKQPRLELPSAVKAVPKPRKTAAAVPKKSRIAPKKAAKARKVA
jgi:hypothetical protein